MSTSPAALPPLPHPPAARAPATATTASHAARFSEPLLPAVPEPRRRRFGRRGPRTSADWSIRARGFLGTLFRASPASTADHLLERLQRLTDELHTSRVRSARWRRHADAYARDREDLARERAHLLAWLAALHPSSAVVARAQAPSPAPAPAPEGTVSGRHVLSVVAGGRPLSWTLAPGEIHLFRHVRRSAETYTHAWWDTRGFEAQYAHIHRHTRMLALEDDMARFAEELRQDG